MNGSDSCLILTIPYHQDLRIYQQKSRMTNFNQFISTTKHSESRKHRVAKYTFLIAFYYLHQLICDDLGAAKTNCKHKTCIFSLYKVDMANLANTCLFKNPASHGETLAFFWGHVCVHLMNINSMLTLLELCFVLLQIFIKNISGALAAKCSTTDQV